MTGELAHRRIAEDAIGPALANALDQPTAFGAALAVASRLASPLRQLVVVTEQPGDELSRAARDSGVELTAVVAPEQGIAFAEAGFELFAGRGVRDGSTAAYLCAGMANRRWLSERPSAS
jgi:uncharacterized protein YyaL (SSP411 family)